MLSGLQEFLDNLQLLQPAWQTQIGADEGQMQALKFTRSPLPPPFSQHTTLPVVVVQERCCNRCGDRAQIRDFHLPQTKANTLMDTQMSVHTNLHLHGWVEWGLFVFGEAGGHVKHPDYVTVLNTHKQTELHT